MQGELFSSRCQSSQSGWWFDPSLEILHSATSNDYTVNELYIGYTVIRIVDLTNLDAFPQVKTQSFMTKSLDLLKVKGVFFESDV